MSSFYSNKTPYTWQLGASHSIGMPQWTFPPSIDPEACFYVRIEFGSASSSAADVTYSIPGGKTPSLQIQARSNGGYDLQVRNRISELVEVQFTECNRRRSTRPTLLLWVPSEALLHTPTTSASHPARSCSGSSLKPGPPPRLVAELRELSDRTLDVFIPTTRYTDVLYDSRKH